MKVASMVRERRIVFLALEVSSCNYTVLRISALGNYVSLIGCGFLVSCANIKLGCKFCDA